MKKLVWFMVFANASLFLAAQNILPLKETKIGLNTIDESTVSVKLFFELKDSSRHFTTAFNFNNKGLSFRVNSITEKENIPDLQEGNRIIFGDNFIGFRFDPDTLLMGKIKAGMADYFIDISDTIIVRVIQKKDTTNYILTPEQVKKHTRNKIILSKEEMTELIQSKGGELNLVGNNIDFGFIPADESQTGKTEYYVNFNYRKGYGIKKELPLYFQASGLLSTNYYDSLNYLKVFPVNYNLSNKNNKMTLQAGIEANQVFSNLRVTGDINWQGLIPNLIDLSYGENRLRLKPVLQAGVKFYQEIDNNRTTGTRENIFSGIVYADAYYYIPVLSAYFLIFEGNLFYDFNSQVNPDKELKYLYSITAGIEIRDSGIKTIFRYTNGETDINYSGSNSIMIGLMADMIKGSLK